MAELVHVDRALARRILGGDEEAFQDLFDRFFPRLYRFALARLRDDPETAKDVVQQTFCQAIEWLDTYRGEAALYTWFCQICRNVLADHFRRSGRSTGRVVLLEDLPNARAVLESLAAPASDEPETGTLRAQLHASSRRPSTRCRAATARRSNGSTSTGCRCARSPSGCR